MLEVVFYKSKTGSEPVREWLKELSNPDKKTIGGDIKTVQLGWPLGMPLVRGLGDALWEVRTNLSGGRIARVIFFMDESAMVLVDGFIKKTKKTPDQELRLAKNRKRDYRLYKG